MMTTIDGPQKTAKTDRRQDTWQAYQSSSSSNSLRGSLVGYLWPSVCVCVCEHAQVRRLESIQGLILVLVVLGENQINLGFSSLEWKKVGSPYFTFHFTLKFV